MPFEGFDPHREVRIYRLKMPHWRQPGATYFITTRLADSIPETKLSQWRHERECWLLANDCKAREDIERLPKKIRHEFHRLFTAKFHDWLDAGHGACWLRKMEAAEVVAGALRFFDGDRYVLDVFVIMPNHLHAIVTPAPEHELSEIVRSWKGCTARKINRLLGRGGTFWQAETYDHIVRREDQLVHYRRYIAENPIKAGLREGEFLLGSGSM